MLKLFPGFYKCTVTFFAFFFLNHPISPAPHNPLLFFYFSIPLPLPWQWKENIYPHTWVWTTQNSSPNKQRSTSLSIPLWKTFPLFHSSWSKKTVSRTCFLAHLGSGFLGYRLNKVPVCSWTHEDPGHHIQSLESWVPFERWWGADSPCPLHQEPGLD